MELPDWLVQMDRLLVETRDMVQSLAEEHPMISEEFLPLREKVADMHAHLDQGMVQYHPDSMPEQDHYRAPDTRTCGQNKARGS